MPSQFTFPGLELGAQLNVKRGLQAQRLGVGISESRRAEVIYAFHREKARDEAKKAAEPKHGGLIGSGVGAAASLIAAPFTGGASLALLPALTSAGGAIGSAFDGSSNPGIGGALGEALEAITPYDDSIFGALGSPGDRLHSTNLFGSGGGIPGRIVPGSVRSSSPFPALP